MLANLINNVADADINFPDVAEAEVPNDSPAGLPTRCSNPGGLVWKADELAPTTDEVQSLCPRSTRPENVSNSARFIKAAASFFQIRGMWAVPGCCRVSALPP